MAIITLAFKSIWNRKFTALLTTLSISTSVALFVCVNRINEGGQKSFEETLSNTDLIVGARSGAINLLLYSVFRMGNPTNNISFESFEKIKKMPEVKWSIPISLGDSFHGHRVIGTNQDYFKFYQYAGGKNLELREGQIFTNPFDVVIGSDVAKKLGQKLGDQISLSHGIGDGAENDLHKNQPFTVVGILKSTGTPVDRSVHIPLEGITAIHMGWNGGIPPAFGGGLTKDEALKEKLAPEQITSFLLGLNSKFALFKMKRKIDDFDEEALSAVLPGQAFSELWQTISVIEYGLKIISLLVVAAGLFGMVATILTSLQERRRELAILRSIGARLHQVFFLLVMESGLLTIAGVVFGLSSALVLLFLSNPFLQENYGIKSSLMLFSKDEFKILLCVIGSGPFVGLIPGIKAYKQGLADGLSIKI